LKKILASILFLGFALNVIAGYVITEKDEELSSTIYIQDNYMKIDDGDAIIMFDLNDQKLYTLMPAIKAYTGGNIDDMKAMMKETLEAAIEGMKDALKENPDNKMVQMHVQSFEEQLQSIDKPMEMKKYDIKVQDTGENEEIAKYKSNKYDIFVNGEKRKAVWLSKDIKIQDELDVKKMLEFQKEMTMISMTTEEDDSAVIDYQITEKLYEIGYPLRELDYTIVETQMELFEENAKANGYELTDEMRKDYMAQLDGEEYSINITNVENKKIDKSEFEIPADYKKMDQKDIIQEAMTQSGQYQ